MEKTEKTMNTTLRVSQDVIASIAKRAALDVDGVEGIDCKKKDLKSVFVKNENDSRGITIKLGVDVVEISMSVVLKHGAKAVATAESVQNAVKAQVQEMTGVVVSRVNVIVSGVSFVEETE